MKCAFQFQPVANQQISPLSFRETHLLFFLGWFIYFCWSKRNENDRLFTKFECWLSIPAATATATSHRHQRFFVLSTLNSFRFTLFFSLFFFLLLARMSLLFFFILSEKKSDDKCIGGPRRHVEIRIPFTRDRVLKTNICAFFFCFYNAI